MARLRGDVAALQQQLAKADADAKQQLEHLHWAEDERPAVDYSQSRLSITAAEAAADEAELLRLQLERVKEEQREERQAAHEAQVAKSQVGASLSVSLV